MVPIFETVPQGKSLLSSSRFQLIDDFNAGLSRTKIDSDWRTEGSLGAQAKLVNEREDAINRYGGSIALEYMIPPHAKAAAITVSKGFDVSQAEFLVLLIRSKEFRAFPGKVTLELSDLKGNAKIVAIDPYLHPRNERWLQVIVPRKVFSPVDFNELSRFGIQLVNSGQTAQGKLVFDEVGFFGPEDLIFKSDRDNLKGFPTQVVLEGRQSELLKIPDDKKFLLEIASDTWRYFDNLIDRETGLAVDHIRVGETTGVGSYISPTNLAFYWLACVAAYDLSLIKEEEALRNIEAGFEALSRLERWEKGFYYNYYHTRNLRVTRRYVSTVDSGWLAAALVVVRNAFPERFGKRATELLKLTDFSKFYDPSNGQLKLGFDGDKNAFSPYHYGLLATEARVASYVAVGKGDLGKEHWARIYRTLPVEWDWQKQIPHGTEAKLFGVPVFHGYYTDHGKKFIPSWGGSLFEFLAPTLVLDEQRLAPEGLGKNNEIVTDLHIEYALKEKGYPVWGLSPCAIRTGRQWSYREYGIPELGAKGYLDRGVIAPYASFLALATRPHEAVRNLREMLARYKGIYGEYGFYDSVNVLKNEVNHQYLMLDQAMSFLAAANYLKDGVIRKRFHSDPIGKAGELLLKDEKLFE